jgi:hypothetical protein
MDYSSFTMVKYRINESASIPNEWHVFLKNVNELFYEIFYSQVLNISATCIAEHSAYITITDFSHKKFNIHHSELKCGI